MMNAITILAMLLIVGLGAFDLVLKHRQRLAELEHDLRLAELGCASDDPERDALAQELLEAYDEVEVHCSTRVLGN